ncbi:MAG: hypothetical protein Q4P08_04380 [Eubacteriales bacterium]|nr:hypothetical protein [Eubacteriales bacterium]
MKIIIEQNTEAKSRRICLPIPNFLLSLTRLIKFAPSSKLNLDSNSAAKTSKIKLEEDGGEAGELKLTKEQIKVLKRELKKMRKQYPGLPLVEVREPDGNGVTIYP